MMSNHMPLKAPGMCYAETNILRLLQPGMMSYPTVKLYTIQKNDELLPQSSS